jgi:hypothetical protein
MSEGPLTVTATTLCVSLGGSVVSSAVFFSQLGSRIDLTVLLFWLWQLFPYALCALMAIRTRPRLAPSVIVCVATLLGSAIGIGLPVMTYLGPPDAQMSLIFIFAPLYQAIVCAPFLAVANVMLT